MQNLYKNRFRRVSDPCGEPEALPSSRRVPYPKVAHVATEALKRSKTRWCHDGSVIERSRQAGTIATSPVRGGAGFGRDIDDELPSLSPKCSLEAGISPHVQDTPTKRRHEIRAVGGLG